MKIAILGTRGVPAAYGGFETLAEELGSRLAERGHEVWVYGRPDFVDSRVTTYRGMNIATVPAIRSKHLETAVLRSQHPRGSGARTGSWDPIGPWGLTAGGRVYSTALMVLALETPYRYARAPGVR